MSTETKWDHLKEPPPIRKIVRDGGWRMEGGALIELVSLPTDEDVRIHIKIKSVSIFIAPKSMLELSAF